MRRRRGKLALRESLSREMIRLPLLQRITLDRFIFRRVEWTDRTDGRTVPPRDRSMDGVLVAGRAPSSVLLSSSSSPSVICHDQISRLFSLPLLNSPPPKSEPNANSRTNLRLTSSAAEAANAVALTLMSGKWRWCRCCCCCSLTQSVTQKAGRAREGIIRD